MRRTWVAVLLVLALAGVAAGCGGSDNTSQTSTLPADEWASNFCGALADWKSAIGDVKSGLTSNLSQDGLQSAADDARAATDTLVSHLKDLGAPDTASGQKVKDAVDSLSTTLDDEVTTIQDTAQGVSGITDLPGAISTISASVSTLLTALSETVKTIDDADASGELKAALEKSPECDSITN
jgi:hypothetical protein